MNGKYFLKLTLIAFLLHLIWENAQAPLYVGYQSFSQHFVICLVAVIGDVIITLAVLACMRFMKKGVMKFSDFVGLAVIGFGVALIIEQHAILVGKWSYANIMPLFPILNVGITPLLQMTLLLPLSFYLAQMGKSEMRNFTQSQEFRLKLYPKNFEKVRNFYESFLDYPVVHEWNRAKDDKGVMFNTGTAILELLSLSRENDYVPIQNAKISLEVHNVKDLWNKVKETASVVHDLCHNEWGDTSFAIRDPENFEITFFTKDKHG